jgi:Holliday junction resolvasome RuvABC endonuclease subunit
VARRPRTTVRTLGNGAVVPVEDLARAMRRTPPKPRDAGSPDATRVLGLDLSIGTTGYALLVAGHPAEHGSFGLPDRARNETLASWLGRRAAELRRQVKLLVDTHRPEVVAYEFTDQPRPSWSGGSKGREFGAVQGLSRAEGMLVALWPTIGGNVRLEAVGASEARRTATGRVNASKDQVRQALMTYRRWDVSRWTEDEVDAAAIALAARERI